MSLMQSKVLDKGLSKDDWFTIFQFLSPQELCNCCLISKEFNEIVNENKCWKFHFLQFSNGSLDKKREINEDNVDWKSLLKNNLSKYAIRLSQSLGNYFKDLNVNFSKNSNDLTPICDLQNLNDCYVIGLKKENNKHTFPEIITKYLKDSFILQTVKFVLNRIKIVNCYLYYEKKGRIIVGPYLELINKFTDKNKSRKYELKFILEIGGIQNNLILRFQNWTFDQLAAMCEEFYCCDQCDYVMWLNYENQDFTTEELKLNFTKRDKSKGFWLIQDNYKKSHVYHNLNILDSILTEIIPVRKVSHLNANNFKPLFVLLLSKIEELFMINNVSNTGNVNEDKLILRGNVIDSNLILNWPKDEEYLLLNNYKQLYHDNSLLNDILTLYFMNKRNVLRQN